MNTLVDLLRFRETVLFNKLVDDSKRLKKEGKTSYQILMRETSDVMQELAQVYGERYTMEYCISVLGKIKNADSHQIMTKVFRLFGADCINRELSFYVVQGVLSQAAIEGIIPTRHALIKDIAVRVSDLMDCMSVPKHALYAPIAGNYLKYNEYPNQGEVINAKM